MSDYATQQSVRREVYSSLPHAAPRMFGPSFKSCNEAAKLEELTLHVKASTTARKLLRKLADKKGDLDQEQQSTWVQCVCTVRTEVEAFRSKFQHLNLPEGYSRVNEAANLLAAEEQKDADVLDQLALQARQRAQKQRALAPAAFGSSVPIAEALEDDEVISGSVRYADENAAQNTAQVPWLLLSQSQGLPALPWHKAREAGVALATWRPKLNPFASLALCQGEVGYPCDWPERSPSRDCRCHSS